MRALLLAIVAALGACTAPAKPVTSPTPIPTHVPGALNVTALLDLSGSRWPSGAPQRDALQLWTDQHATATPRVRLRIVDVAGSASRTLIELRRAAVEDRADAIIVGVPVDYDDAFARAVQLTQLPVLFTLPIADPVTTGGGWAFALAPTPSQLARTMLDDAAARAVLGSSVVVTDESAPAIIERAAFVAELASRGVTATIVKAADGTKLRTMLASASVALFAGPPKPYVDAARTATTGTLLSLRRRGHRRSARRRAACHLAGGQVDRRERDRRDARARRVPPGVPGSRRPADFACGIGVRCPHAARSRVQRER